VTLAGAESTSICTVHSTEGAIEVVQYTDAIVTGQAIEISILKGENVEAVARVITAAFAAFAIGATYFVGLGAVVRYALTGNRIADGVRSRAAGFLRSQGAAEVTIPAAVARRRARATIIDGDALDTDRGIAGTDWATWIHELAIQIVAASDVWHQNAVAAPASVNRSVEIRLMRAREVEVATVESAVISVVAVSIFEAFDTGSERTTDEEWLYGAGHVATAPVFGDEDSVTTRAGESGIRRTVSNGFTESCRTGRAWPAVSVV
jgi:hypothetical protein